MILKSLSTTIHSLKQALNINLQIPNLALFNAVFIVVSPYLFDSSGSGNVDMVWMSMNAFQAQKDKSALHRTITTVISGEDALHIVNFSSMRSN